MNLRVLICTVVGLLAVLAVIAFTPKEAFLPKGIVLPAQKIRPAISPNDVVIYDQAPAFNYQRLGSISIEQAYRAIDPKTKMLLTDKIKSMAAAVGANGVIVTLFMPVNQLHQMIIFQGTAIYIPSAAAGSKK